MCFAVNRVFDIRNRPRIPIPDEDPYTLAADLESSGSSGFGNGIYGHVPRDPMMMHLRYPNPRRDKPPKLPPRQTDHIYGRHEMSSLFKVRGTYAK